MFWVMKVSLLSAFRSRQLYASCLHAHEPLLAMKKMATSNVLIVGMKGLGVEIGGLRLSRLP